MFKYNNKILKNKEIGNITITVELGANFKDNDWEDNEEFTHLSLVKNKNTIPMDIECPIDDLVYLQPKFSGTTDEGYYIRTKKDYELLKIAYTKIQETFEEKIVEVSIHSDDISDEYNEVTMSLEEFLTVYSLD